MIILCHVLALEGKQRWTPSNVFFAFFYGICEDDQRLLLSFIGTNLEKQKKRPFSLPSLVDSFQLGKERRREEKQSEQGARASFLRLSGRESKKKDVERVSARSRSPSLSSNCSS